MCFALFLLRIENADFERSKSPWESALAYVLAAECLFLFGLEIPRRNVDCAQRSALKITWAEQKNYRNSSKIVLWSDQRTWRTFQLIWMIKIRKKLRNWMLIACCQGVLSIFLSAAAAFFCTEAELIVFCISVFDLTAFDGWWNIRNLKRSLNNKFNWQVNQNYGLKEKMHVFLHTKVHRGTKTWTKKAVRIIKRLFEQTNSVQKSENGCSPHAILIATLLF